HAIRVPDPSRVSGRQFPSWEGSGVGSFFHHTGIQMKATRSIIHYRTDLTELARELRRNMTLAEVLLWKQLKGKQLCGYDFDRQKPLGRRIVDFYSKELALAVDVDGSVHDF